MKIKCILVDDEPLAINVIKKHLDSFESFEVIHTCNNAIEAFNILSRESIDLIFLDINMPRLNGIEFIKNLNNPPFIIITSAYREYAVEGFELDVTDYLVKPISLNRMMKALNKVSRNWDSRESTFRNNFRNNTQNRLKENHFFVKVNKKMVKIYFDDILYIESLKDYVSIKTDYEDYVTHYNLAAIVKLLPSYQFMRIHRSFAISLNKVKAIDGNCIQIKDKKIPMGRNYVKDVKNNILKGIIEA